MIQPGRGARLGAQALDGLLVFRELFRNELERHGTPEPVILGSVDDAHPAGAKLADDVVVSNGPPDHDNVRFI